MTQRGSFETAGTTSLGHDPAPAVTLGSPQELKRQRPLMCQNADAQALWQQPYRWLSLLHPNLLPVLRPFPQVRQL